MIDGDTVDVVCAGTSARVRLLRVDTPERGQAGYAQAREALEDMLAGRDVYLAFEEPGRPELGTYGRLLAYLFAGGENVNVEMVRQGYSKFWTKYGKGRFSADFADAEDDAGGLW